MLKQRRSYSITGKRVSLSKHEKEVHIYTVELKNSETEVFLYPYYHSMALLKVTEILLNKDRTKEQLYEHIQ